MAKRNRHELPQFNDTVTCTSIVTPRSMAPIVEQLPSFEEPEEEPEPEETPDIVEISPTEFYKQFVEKTVDQANDLTNAEQRSESWKKAREYILTASNFGAATGNNPHMSPIALVKDKLWNEFQGNKFTEYGNLHEPDARSSFLEYIHTFDPGATLEERNLITTSDCPWLGVSPDNFLRWSDGTIDLVEYKCPYFLKEGHPYKQHPGNIPPYYYDQMQGILGYMNQFVKQSMQASWFVVWTPNLTFVTRLKYDADYWQSMYQKLHSWYFSLFLPSLTHKYNGLLTNGEIKPSSPLIV
jgi:putative phage-type endonuclease